MNQTHTQTTIIIHKQTKRLFHKQYKSTGNQSPWKANHIAPFTMFEPFPDPFLPWTIYLVVEYSQVYDFSFKEIIPSLKCVPHRTKMPILKYLYVNELIVL
jgi:hypothetical protein